MDNKLEILNANYWENFKFEKELALIYPPEHFKRLKMSKECNEILKEVHKIKENERK